MKQLLNNGKGEFLFSSSSASLSLGSYTPLGNENEDDCYGILPSLQIHKKKIIFKILGSPVLSLLLGPVFLFLNSFFHTHCFTPFSIKSPEATK